MHIGRCTNRDNRRYNRNSISIGPDTRTNEVSNETGLINKVSEHSIPASAGGDEYDKWQIKEEQIEREMENYLGTTNEHEWPWSFKGPLPDACSLVRAFEEDDELFNTVHRCEKYDD
jgi:hypothetical protein